MGHRYAQKLGGPRDREPALLMELSLKQQQQKPKKASIKTTQLELASIKRLTPLS